MMHYLKTWLAAFAVVINLFAPENALSMTMLSPGVVSYQSAGGITYATWNPADKDASITLSGGNLTMMSSSTASTVRSTIGRSTGKWYAEFSGFSGPTNTAQLLGIANATHPLNNYVGQTTNSWGVYLINGNKYTNASPTAYMSAVVLTDTVSIALDMSNGCVYYAINGTWQNGGSPTSGASCTGAAFTGLTGTIYFATGGDGASVRGLTANFGATAFTYAPPTGYNAGFY